MASFTLADRFTDSSPYGVTRDQLPSLGSVPYYPALPDLACVTILSWRVRAETNVQRRPSPSA